MRTSPREGLLLPEVVWVAACPIRPLRDPPFAEIARDGRPRPKVTVQADAMAVRADRNSSSGTGSPPKSHQFWWCDLDFAHFTL